jgi:uncharacterized protein YciI
MRASEKMPIFVKIEQGKVDKSTFDQYVPAHKAYVQELIAKGHKARTGYWAEARGGMLLFEAASMAEAEAIVASDPLVQHGCVHYQLYEWRIVME